MSANRADRLRLDVANRVDRIASTMGNRGHAKKADRLRGAMDHAERLAGTLLPRAEGLAIMARDLAVDEEIDLGTRREIVELVQAIGSWNEAVR